MHYIIFLAILLANPFLPVLEALYRDYSSSPYYCSYHIPDDYPVWEIVFLDALPETGPKCMNCDEASVYPGYIDPALTKYLGHLKRQAGYYKCHDCECNWPEFSQEAARISDAAYLLFNDLISTTALSNLIDKKNEQKDYFNNSRILTKRGVILSCIVHQFHFSDYYRVCRDIENYAISKYNETETI